ncbi:MAG0490 family ComEA-like DNA-binding protein [Mycoplasma sp. 6243]|uniref:MAG0490 family ComEA-like DNA-binding protein n=1 Tax=Mycoplasma sp. 6243 TaxID=3440865 RepID=UPI003EBF1A4A
MKAKIFKYIISIILIAATLGTLSYFTFFATPQQNTAKKEMIKRYILKGAVKQTGIHESSSPLTYRQLFFITKLLPDGDVSAFKLDDLAIENKEIYVPFKNHQLNWEDLHSINQLTSYGISKSYAQKIIDYKESKGYTTTWDELSKISGIGQKTIEKLRTFLILE